MGTFKEITEEIKKVDQKITESSIRVKKFRKIAACSDDVHQKIAYKCADEEEDNIIALRLQKEFLRDNVRWTMFKEDVPTILGIMNKYVGQRYSNKIRKQISQEVYKETGLNCHLNEGFHLVCSKEMSHGNGFSIICDFFRFARKEFLENSVIQHIDFNDVFLCDDIEYVGDVEERSYYVLEIYKKAQKMQQELFGLCADLNVLLPESVNPISGFESLNVPILRRMC